MESDHQMELVKVTHIEDSITFWAQSITSHEAIEQMNNTLGEVCLKSQRLHGAPNYNKIYGALFSKDNNWYRCKVQLHLDIDDKFMISYFDYGNREMVRRSAIVELPEDLQQSPCLAKKYKFWGLQIDPYSPSIKLGFLQNLMFSKTVRVHMRSITFDGTILVQAFQGNMDIGEELIKMKLAQANVLWSQREIPPLKEPAVSWLQKMMERGQGIDGISTFPVCMPKLRPIFTDQKPSSATERAINVSKPAIAAEKTMDVSNGVEKTMDVSNAVEKTMDVSNAVERTMEVSNAVEKTMEVSNAVEKTMEVSNAVEKTMEVSNAVEKTMDVSNAVEKMMDVANASTVEKKMDVTDTAENQMDTVILEENQRLKEELQDQKQRCLQKEKELKYSYAKIQLLKESSANLSKEAQRLEALQAVVTNTSQQLQKRIQDEKNIDTVILENQGLKAELEVQKQHCLQKEKELKDSYAEIQELKENSANLSKETQRLETLVDDMTNESQQLQKRLQDADLTMQVMKEEIVKKEKEMDKLLHAGISEQLGRLVEKVHALREIRKSLFAGDGDTLMEAFNTVVRNSMSAPVATEELEVAWKDYMCVQEKLRACEKQEEVNDLVDQRNMIRSLVTAAADRFLEAAKPLPVRERMETLEEVTASLTAVFGPSSEEDVGEHIIEEYHQWVKEKEQHMTSIRDDSNNALNGLSTWASNVGKFFSLSNETLVTMKDVIDGADRVLNLAELNVCRELDICLSKVGQIEQDSRVITRVFHKVMQNIQKEKKVLIDIMDKYLFHIKFKEMIESQDVSPSPATLLQIKKKIRCLKSQLRWRQVEKNSLEEAEELDLTEISKKSEEIAETRNLLFQEIHREKEEYNKLRVLAEGEFPELPLLYPEVDLNIFMSSGGLLINSLDRDLFDAEPVKELSDHRPLVCTEFQGQRVLLKSYTVNEEMEVRVLERTTQFHRVATENKEDSGILPLLALFFSKSDPVAYIMVPYFPNGSLKVVQAINPLMDTEVVRVMKGVARGLQALHAMGVTHGSLNPSNTFVVNRNRGLVGDFDFTKTLEQRAVNNGLAGSIHLVAPELRQGITTPSPACDMFAFGCLMLWLHVPEFNGSLDNLEPLSLESKLGDLLSKLLVSGERLAAKEVLACEYFSVDL